MSKNPPFEAFAKVQQKHELTKQKHDFFRMTFTRNGKSRNCNKLTYRNVFFNA